MRRLFFILQFTILVSAVIAQGSWSILESSRVHLKLKYISKAKSLNEIEVFYCIIGLPHSHKPYFDFSYSNPIMIQKIASSDFPRGVEWLQFQNLKGLETGTLALSPLDMDGTAYEEVIVNVYFDDSIFSFESEIPPQTESFLKHRVVNWDISKNWISYLPLTRNKTLNDIPSFTLNHISENIDYIMIGSSDYNSHLSPLIQHRNSSLVLPLNTIFISTDSIYHTYSEGDVDPLAIKSFFNDALSISNNLQYGLLVGDVPELPTLYEGSYASDDLLVTFNGGIPQIALGRFPAKTSQDVSAFVNKLIKYETEPELGLWKQKITLVADDEARPHVNDTTHTSYSEKLSQIIPSQFDVQKVYLMEYPESNDASLYGVSKPEATEDFLELIQSGTLIINYIGHGSYHKWAQEGLLDKNRGDISLIQTGNRLPIWIAGTCSWGAFDDPEDDAFSEDIIRLEGNGAIAIITTSRSVYEGPNWILLKSIYETMFPSGEITDLPLGLVLQSVKTGSITGKVFHLFGDPAMMINFIQDPIDLIISEPIEILTPESVSSEQYLSSNGGTGLLIVRESNRIVEREYSYLSTSGWVESSISYSLPGTILSVGEISFTSSVVNGYFWVPLDLNNSKIDIKMYIQTETFPYLNALGYKKGINVITSIQNNDFDGPEIVFSNSVNENLGYGDHIDPGSILLLKLTDVSGINLTGEPGHEIKMQNLSTGEINYLTNQFIYNFDDITSGKILLNLSAFNFPLHIEVQCWDNANNPARKEILLNALSSSELHMFSVYNYPNPFKSDTKFTFEITEPAKVSVSIYTLEGTKIKDISPELFPVGYHQIYWDGRDAFGKDLFNGVYIYRIKAEGENETISKINRLAIFK